MTEILIERGVLFSFLPSYREIRGRRGVDQILGVGQGRQVHFGNTGANDLQVPGGIKVRKGFERRGGEEKAEETLGESP